MIGDIKQSAKNWFCDCLEIFSEKLKADEDPTLEIEIAGIKLELRLMESPGQFKRMEIEIPLKNKA